MKGKEIVDQMMQEHVVYGGMLFTRFGLLKELQERKYCTSFIDFIVFGYGIAYPAGGETLNTVPNEGIPDWFWGELSKANEEPAPDPMDESKDLEGVSDAESLIAELISQRGPRNTEPGC